MSTYDAVASFAEYLVSIFDFEAVITHLMKPLIQFKLNFRHLAFNEFFTHEKKRLTDINFSFQICSFEHFLACYV